MTSYVPLLNSAETDASTRCLPQTLLDQFLRRNVTVAFFHLWWTDFTGVLRDRVIPREQCVRLASQDTPFPIGAYTMIGLSVTQVHSFPRDEFKPGASDGLYPDWTSLQVIAPGEASVMCFTCKLHITDGISPMANGLERCPRMILKNVISKAQLQFGIEILAGFELEFFLIPIQEYEQMLLTGRPPAISKNSAWSTAEAMRGTKAKCVFSCVQELQAAGIKVEQFHAESATSQYEIATGCGEVVTTIDRLVCSQEIIKSVAMDHGFRATFFPRPFAGLGPSGLHVHLSCERREEASHPASSQHSLNEHFLAGIMHRLSLLCAFAMPSGNSYERLDTPHLSPWVAWGTQNRNAPVRQINSKRWEIRTLDATANVYLALAAFIASGLLGIRDSQPLTLGDCRLWLSDLSDEERAALGITKQLPRNIKEALGLYDQDTMHLEDMLGKAVLDFYGRTKRGEAERVAAMTAEAKLSLYMGFF